jgi:hypothetical protein
MMTIFVLLFPDESTEVPDIQSAVDTYLIEDLRRYRSHSGPFKSLTNTLYRAKILKPIGT